ncbi:hypothetical protein FIU82_06000 [Pseudoalteromonas sp. THAF3]|uniref:hypothetical protein n=1 Tax=Pseudoalteromonas sp. THAF3 TaxID=2587843 RepID=UPI001268415A|nr:hypothetical protein [Pseudoalteromonas sp. THAF3]QFU04568.1 hypothetical protein FIU82_06000 [Pseudoalteromonas sp. THAF3]
MLFVNNITSLLNKASALCEKAITAANKQIEAANNKTEKLQEQIREQGSLIDKANKDKAIAEALRGQLTTFTEEAAKNAE